MDPGSSPRYLHRHLCPRVVPSTRFVKRGSRQRTVEVWVARRILDKVVPKCPNPQYVSYLVEFHITIPGDRYAA